MLLKCSRCKSINTPLTNYSIRHGKKYYMCRPCNTERAKKYRATKKGKIKIYNAVYKSIAKHRKKHNARTLVAYYLDTGRMTKKACFCGASKTEAHHPDYSKPLDVVWLCRTHHSDVHNPKVLSVV